jgi:hypothetical protein
MKKDVLIVVAAIARAKTSIAFPRSQRELWMHANGLEPFWVLVRPGTPFFMVLS